MDLVYGQAKISDTTQKKLTANDKSLEPIQAKFDGFSTTINNMLSLNKILETQLAQLAAATIVDIGKILGQLDSTLESVNAVTTRWGEPPRMSPYSNYIEKLTQPRRGSWGELAASIG